MSKFYRFTLAYWYSHPDEHESIANEHLDRAKKGKLVWNKWAKEFTQHIKHLRVKDPSIKFSGLIIEESINFVGLIFPCFTSFSNTVFNCSANFNHAEFSKFISFVRVEFNDQADFSNAQFKGRVSIFSEAKFFGDDTYFTEAVFSGAETYFNYAIFKGKNIDFSDAQFNGNSASFSNTQFLIGKANFSNTRFRNVVEFMDSKFDQTPNFNFTSFLQPPHLANVDIKFIPKKEFGNVEKYRKLKQMAIQSNDHENELKFFGYETHAKAYLETTPFYQKAFIKLYYWLSDFGSSLGRPIFSLLVFLLLMTGLNTALIKPNSEACQADTSEFIYQTTAYTLSEAVPLMGLSEPQEIEMTQCLFGHQTPNLWRNAWNMLHIIPTSILLFLFGLGVRNRFKIK